MKTILDKADLNPEEVFERFHKEFSNPYFRSVVINEKDYRKESVTEQEALREVFEHLKQYDPQKKCLFRSCLSLPTWGSVRYIDFSRPAYKVELKRRAKEKYNNSKDKAFLGYQKRKEKFLRINKMAAKRFRLGKIKEEDIDAWIVKHYMNWW